MEQRIIEALKARNITNIKKDGENLILFVFNPGLLIHEKITINKNEYRNIFKRVNGFFPNF